VNVGLIVAKFALDEEAGQRPAVDISVPAREHPIEPDSSGDDRDAAARWSLDSLFGDQIPAETHIAAGWSQDGRARDDPIAVTACSFQADRK